MAFRKEILKKSMRTEGRRVSLKETEETSSIRPSFLVKVMERTLETIETIYQKEKKISDEQLMSLHHVFGPVAESALELLETASFERYITDGNSPFNLYKVTSSSTKSYYILKDFNLCKCDSFNYQVRRSRSRVTCKHVLACRIAIITERIDPTPYRITLDELRCILKDHFENNI